MTFEQNSARPRRFVTSTLPWLIGLGAFVIYLATMTRWVTFGNASLVSRLAGWSWQSEVFQPLHYLVLLPFRFLPETILPTALNVFNAALAALVVTLVARIITLLPHDRTADQREIEGDENSIFSGRTAWIPPVLGAIVLGLQISFWECATAINGEMIDALIVAYVIRCLLEFRIDQQQSWLSRAAFFYAAGMTNNWALVGLAPVFLAAVIWIKGLGFFNLGFLTRMAVWGLIGLLFYLVLPLVQSQSDVLPWTFWQALKTNLGTQVGALRSLYGYLNANNAVLLPALTSVLPLLFISLRWKSSFGDNSPIGIFVTKTVFHFAHALFLGVCLLVVLNPPYSPRQLLFTVPAVFGGAHLTHSILSVIVVGYCAGYFLLVCSPALRSRTRMNAILRLAGYVGWGAVVVLLLAMPVILIGRNLEAIQLTNNRLVNQFASHLQQGLPSGSCAILSDDPVLLSFLRWQELKKGRAQKELFYDTRYAAYTDYHKFQVKHQPALWPAVFASHTNNVELRPRATVHFLDLIGEKMPIVYLQPSFGYYFERFQLIPRGITYPLQQYSTNTLLPGPLSTDIIKANEEFWRSFDESLLPVLKRLQPTDKARDMPGWQQALYSRLHLKRERVYFAEGLAMRYSRASVHWAVEQQKLGQWDTAALSLERALVLNPENVAARINLAYNTAHREGKLRSDEALKQIEDYFAHVDAVLNAFGPLDEPTLLFEQSRTFVKGSLYRQALQQVQRVAELEPDNYPARIWLVDLYATLGRPKQALEIVQEVRRNTAVFKLNSTNEFELVRAEANALFRDSRKEEAAAALAEALKRPHVPTPFRFASSQLYLQYGLYADALPLLELAISENQGDVMALANHGFTCLQLGRLGEATNSLSRALELDPKNQVARLNRAIAFTRTKQYDSALADYDILRVELPNAYQVRYGLGETALGKGDTNGAIEHFKSCLPLVPAGSRDYLQISNRLAELKAPKP